MANVIPQIQANYTDTATVLAVQRALAAKGFAPKKGIDGKWGPDTSMALRSWEYESGSDDVDGVINYGVLLKLGVSPPNVSSMTNASNVADAAAKARAGAALDDANRAAQQAEAAKVEAARAAEAAKVEAARAAEEVKAKAAVEAAKAKVATAATPAAAQVAQQQLAVAEKKLEEVKVPFFKRYPWWQIAVCGGGALAVATGIGFLVFGGKKK
jgi:peptidoglycan hydrolase-like protein with peptidoglycan-binding domain